MIPSYQLKNVIGRIAILLMLAVSVASLQSAGTRGKDPTGTSDPSMDFDGDGLKDNEDADPDEILVDWKKVPESSYVLVEVEVPASPSDLQDFNDHAEVLFSFGIWANGSWTPREAADGSGVVPGDGGAHYNVRHGGWRYFNNDRTLLGSSHLTFTDTPAAGGDGLDVPSFWPGVQSSASLIYDTAGLWGDIYWGFRPTGITSAGQMIVRGTPLSTAGNSTTITVKLDRFNLSGAFAGSMYAPNGYQVAFGNWGHSEVTSSGWVASNLAPPSHSGPPSAYRLGLWNAANSSVPLPSEASHWGYPVSVSDLPHGKVVLVGGKTVGVNYTGRVFLPDATGQYQAVPSLSLHQIERFAGDGTAMTLDDKIWRNGKVIPLRDLCQKFGELLDQGYSFQSFKANKHGSYLMSAGGPEGEEKTYVLHRIEVNWKAIDGFANVDDHIDPWGRPIYGKRIFPDFKNPVDTEIRHKLEVIVKTSPALAGQAVFAKAFDVDDSTSEDFDREENGSAPVIDTIGIAGAGDDNLLDYLGTPKTGQFWTGSAWGGQTAQGTVDANGEAKFIFRVGMQPGSNYRVVASVIDESMYAGVQVSDPAEEKYLGPETNQDGGGAASPLLTVWRRLWVENDSMAAPGLHSGGYLKNDLTSDVSNPTIKNSLIANGDTIVQFLPVITDQSSLRNLENGILILPPSGLYRNFSAFANNGPLGDGVILPGAHPEIEPGHPFRLYDDDDFGLNRAPLPRNDLIDDTFKNVYKPAFIEVVDAANFNGQDYNPSKTVDFYRNYPVMVGLGFPLYILTPGVWDDAINLTDSKPLWVGNLIAGYQGEVGQDGDPITEGHMEGITPESRRYSIVYVENVRDYNDPLIRNPSTDNTAMNSEIVRNIKLTAAHEIGHMPGGGDETSHHAENMLMGEDGYGSDNGLNFSPMSILRFRKTNQWQQP